MAYGVEYWGQMLGDSHVSLPDYVEAENRYINSVQSSDLRILASDEKYESLTPKRLQVSHESTLLLEIMDLPFVDKWKEEAILIPGAWPTTPTLPVTIMWYPEDNDSRDGMLWVWTGSVYMVPTSHGRKSTDTNQESCEIRNLFRGARRR